MTTITSVLIALLVFAGIAAQRIRHQRVLRADGSPLPLTLQGIAAAAGMARQLPTAPAAGPPSGGRLCWRRRANDDFGPMHARDTGMLSAVFSP